jgi:hypothetical protein
MDDPAAASLGPALLPAPARGEVSRRVAPLAWLLLPLAACGSPGSGPFDAGGDAPIDSGSAASDALLVDASSPAGRTVLWSSDFSTGDFSQWNVQDTAHGGAVSVGSDSVASIVAAPAGFPGTYAAQLAAYGDSTGQAHIPPKVRVQLNSTRTQTAEI